jgi:hypothetical protein
MNKTPHKETNAQLPPATEMLLQRAAEKLKPEPKKDTQK